MFESYQPYKTPTKIGVVLPSISIEPRHYSELGVSPDISNYDFLRRLCWKGIQEKGIDKLPNAAEYFSRVKHELKVFEDTGFIDYVLLNWEVHTFCRENDIPTGWGRGSAAGSLVFYLIGVTKHPIDPIKYELYFERFLSAVRAKKIEFEGKTYLDGGSLCDVDSDISYSERHKVIEYIEQKYKGKNAKILTLGTLGSKAVITECSKIVGGLDKTDAKAISDSIPKAFNIPLSIKDALKESEKFAAFEKKYPKVFKIAKKLEDLIKNTSVHASGIAISHDDIDSVMPLQVSTDDEGQSFITTGYEMGDVGSLSVKLDILGLKTISIVNETCKAVGIKIEDIPEDDPETYKFLNNLLAPQGLFQIETDTGFEVCRKVKPRNLHDLAAIVALARPGALAFVDKYADFVRTGEAQSVHPFFDSILQRTGSIPIFQEQLMSMIVKVGFSKVDSNTVRSCVGKKKVEEMKLWKQKIYDKVKEEKLDQSVADTVWKVAEDSANYQFCAGHSFPYGHLSYITSYLKTHHLKEFYCASLNVAAQSGQKKDAIEKIAAISRESLLFNMRILPPDFSKSKMIFTPEGNDIRYGWSCIKGISEKKLEPLLSFCGKTLTTKYEVFMEAKESKLPINSVRALIQAGCMDSFNTERCLLVLEAQMFNELTEKEKLKIIELGPRHNYNIIAALKEIGEGKLLNEKGKPFLSEKRINTLREKYKTYRRIYEQNHKHKEFTTWFFEKTILGYSYSYNLREVFEGEKSFTPIINLQSLDDGAEVKIVGTVEESIKRKSQKGNNYMRLTIADETGTFDAQIGDYKKEQKLTNWLKNNKQPEEDQIVVLVGKKNKDTVFIDSLKIMDEIVAFSKKDLKE